MKDKSTKNEFIKLKVDGLSLRDISEKLNVSLSALCKWNKKYFSEIDFLKNEDIKQIKSEYLKNQSNVLNFSELVFNKIEKELKSSPVFMSYENMILNGLKLLNCMNNSKAEIIKTNAEIEQLNLTESHKNEILQDVDKSNT